MRIPISGETKDVAHWVPTPQGNFTISSAWETIRHQQESMGIFNSIWNPAISPSMSIFVWRLLINRIPVDTKLQWRNIHLASKCRCCKQSREESREHLFIHGEAATTIWNFFANWFPDAPQFPNDEIALGQRIRWWHIHLVRVAKDHVSILLPTLVMWFIWTERNNVIHRGAVFNCSLVIDRIQNHLQWAILARKIHTIQWKGMTAIANFKFPRRSLAEVSRPQAVRWLPPQCDWTKLNIAGAFLESSLPAGGGGVIRDTQGRIMRGFAIQSEACSRVEAVLQALITGVDMAKRFGNKIWIETDVHEVVGMMGTRTQGAAELRHTLMVIRTRLKGCQFKLSHIPKVGNRIADSLAGRGREEEQQFVFDQDSAPPLIKALARMEQLGIPNVRYSEEANEEVT